MKKSIILSSIALSMLIFGCGGNENAKTSDVTKTETEGTETKSSDPNQYDPKRGEGKWTAENLALTDKLDATMAAAGETASGVKCGSCHKYSDEKLVGPGWKDVTTRRTAEWIMNFITNPDPMIDKDPQAQAMLELCLVRMPNQNLSDEEARQILEFMRKNDGIK